MLTPNATLLLGDSLVSIDILRKVLSTTSKFFHGLVSSDLNPNDHQNFASCQKICRDEVFEVLEHIDGSSGTIIYLSLLRSVIDAYHEKGILFLKRIYFAWHAVFISRIWLTWIQTTTKEELDDKLTTLTEHWNTPCRRSIMSKQQFFLTTPE
jgi:hypothetical protein